MLRAALTGLFLAIQIWLSGSALAANYTSGTITILVPYAPGGSADILARLLADKLQPALGQPVVVENRVGGSELTATDILARSAPDGHTLAVLSNAIAINETLVPNRKYDLAKDMVPVAKLIELPFALLVNSKLPVQTVADLVKLAKTQPGKLNYGHLGPGSPHYFTMEWFKQAAGIDILAVPYRGAAPAYAALVSGEVQIVASGLGAATPFLESGQAKAIAAMSDKRPHSAPNLPTIGEAGFPNFRLASWMGLFARAGTPDNLLVALEQVTRAAMADQDVVDRLLKLGLEPAAASREGFARSISQDVINWREIINRTSHK